MIISLYIKLVLVISMIPGPTVEVTRSQPTCLECHEDLLAGSVRHEALSGSCEDCHESTGAEHPASGIKGFKLIDPVPGICFYCHDTYESKAYVHLPVEKGACLDCHAVHSAGEAHLLIKPPKDLCLGCHNKPYATDSTYTASIGKLISTGKTVHAPLEDGDCLTCHMPHESENFALLADKYPDGPYTTASPDNFAICFLCHDSQIIEAAETDWATNFRNGNKNMHFLHINGNEGRNCDLCHNVHAAPNNFLIEDEVRFGHWNMRLNFEPSESGGSCWPGCHGKAAYDRNPGTQSSEGSIR